MVLMAIDHVRVYSGVPAGGPTAGVFFTRLYLVWAIDVAILYVACRWYMHFKATRPRPWMRYV